MPAYDPRSTRGAPAGTFAITAVEPERMWSARAGIPFGSLRGVSR